MKGNKARGRPFTAGQSGNPGGRPKAIREVQELARAHTVTAIEKLAEIAENGKSESAQIAAAVALLDRGWGRPAQTLHATHTLDERDAAELTYAELMEIAGRGSSGGSAAE
jgi:hypothetical protein